MALPGIKPKVNDKLRLKLLLYGDWKVGKSTAAAKFPSSYFIDCERGAQQEQYVKLLQDSGAIYLDTNEFAQVLAAVKALLSEKHDRRTLTIDPISALYTDLVDEGERLKGDEWGKHYGYADTHMKRLFLLIDKLDMNVICTSHAKPEYIRTGAGQPEATGKLQPDAWKKLPYQFDLILELRRHGASGRRAEVRGTRLAQFPDGETFEWSYEEFVKRLGKARLEREAESVELASPEAVRELTRLMTEAKVSDQDSEKWLKKAGVAQWEDAPAEHVAKTIAYLTKRLAPATP